MTEGVTLREFIERILTEHERAHDAQHQAVAIAAKELERRLDLLNHAHEQSLQDRSEFVTKDRQEAMANALAGETKNLAALMDARIKTLENFKSKAVAVGAVLVLFAGAVGAAIAKALGA